MHVRVVLLPFALLTPHERGFLFFISPIPMMKEPLSVHWPVTEIRTDGSFTLAVENPAKILQDIQELNRHRSYIILIAANESIHFVRVAGSSSVAESILEVAREGFLIRRSGDLQGTLPAKALRLTDGTYIKGVDLRYIEGKTDEQQEENSRPACR